MKKTTRFLIGVSLLVVLIVLFRSKNEENTSDKNPLSKVNSKQEAVAKGSSSSSPPPPPKLKAWYSGGTLHGAKRRGHPDLATRGAIGYREMNLYI